MPIFNRYAAAGMVLMLSGAALADSKIEHRVASQLPTWLAESNTPSAAVAFIESGKIQWTLVAGERASGIPATRDTLYNVASMTKPITAEVVLRLASAGHFELNQSMASHWIDPDVKDDPRHEQITPYLCLSHQCGFPNWRHETDGKLVFQWNPATRPGYSGEGYDYVARFVAARMDTTFPELAQKVLFQPLGMNDTAFTTKAWFAGRVAVPRGPQGEYGKPDLRSEWSAADDLHTTIADYASFVASVMQGAQISDAVRKQRWNIDHDMAEMICQPGRLEGKQCPQRMGFAPGWARFESHENTIFFHGGGDWGERSMAFFSPEQQIGVIVLTNGANGMQVIRNVAALLYDDPAFIAFLTMQAGS